MIGMYQRLYTNKNLWGGCKPAVQTTVWNSNKRITNSANIEQLGIIRRYVFEGKPRERLFEYIDCYRTTGEELCNSIFKAFEKSLFNIEYCRSQTMDGAENTSGRNKGYAVLLQEKARLAVYNYCANHDLNLVLGKCSKVPEIHVMLDSLKQLGIFLKYSPKTMSPIWRLSWAT